MSARSEHVSVPASFVFTELVLTLGFVLTGSVTTLIGPLLPVLAAQWSLSDAALGRFFVAQFVGSTLGALVSDRAAGMFGRTKNLFIGFLLITVGVWGLASVAALLAFLAVFVYGIGLGLTIPAINFAIADLRRKSSASALNLLNMLWTLGALASPLMVSLGLRRAAISTVIHAVTITSLVIALLVTAVRLPRISASATDAHNEAPRRSVPGAAWWLFALVFFLYVGLENSIAGWAAAYAQQSGAVRAIASAALVPAAFWSSLLVGRLMFSLAMIRFLPPSLASKLGVVLTSAGCVMLLISRGSGLMLTAISIVGFGLAPVFPNAIAAAKLLLSARDLAPLFACAGIGGAVVPYLVGVTSTHQSLAAGIELSCVVSVLLLLLQLRVSAITREYVR